jgi:hypothetical protein
VDFRARFYDIRRLGMTAMEEIVCIIQNRPALATAAIKHVQTAVHVEADWILLAHKLRYPVMVMVVSFLASQVFL